MESCLSKGISTTWNANRFIQDLNFIKVIQLRFFKVENKAISSLICKWIFVDPAEHFSDHSNSLSNKENNEMPISFIPK